MELTTCFDVKNTSSGKPIPLDDIYDGTFQDNDLQVKAVNCFCKKIQMFDDAKYISVAVTKTDKTTHIFVLPSLPSNP